MSSLTITDGPRTYAEARQKLIDYIRTRSDKVETDGRSFIVYVPMLRVIMNESPDVEADKQMLLCLPHKHRYHFIEACVRERAYNLCKQLMDVYSLCLGEQDQLMYRVCHEVSADTNDFLQWLITRGFSDRSTVNYYCYKLRPIDTICFEAPCSVESIHLFASMVQTLIAGGADIVNASNEHTPTPFILHASRFWCNEQTLTFLLFYGAYPSVCDDNLFSVRPRLSAMEIDKIYRAESMYIRASAAMQCVVDMQFSQGPLFYFKYAFTDLLQMIFSFYIGWKFDRNFIYRYAAPYMTAPEEVLPSPKHAKII